MLNNKCSKGFTLIELLIVIAIIGILMAIAVPAYLGQREKARVRAVEGSARGAESDVLAVLDAYVAGDPFVRLNSSGNEVCTQSSDAAQTGKTCQNIYNQANTGQYAAYPDGMAAIINAIIDHHAGKKEKSPFGTGSLFITGTPAKGTVVVTPTGSRSLTITAYGESASSPLWSTVLFAR